MRISIVIALAVALLTGCSKSDQQRAQDRAKEAAEKTRTEMHKLGTEAKAEAQKLNSELGQGVHRNSTSEAAAKLDHAGQIAHREAAEAGRKLDRATLIARVKAKLASNVSVGTITNVRVDVNGSTAVLSGTVSTTDQKRLAEQAASQVDGISHVENQIQVQP